MMIIDIHAHTSAHKLWDLHTETATIDYLEKEALKYGITKIVLLATYFPLKKSGLCNEELLKRIDKKDLFLAFGSLDVSEEDLTAGVSELDQLAKEKKIAGIKLYPGYQDFDPGGKKIFPVYDLARNYNVPVMFHGGGLHGCCKKIDMKAGRFKCGYDHCRLEDLKDLSRPSSMIEAFQNFPDVKFVISHLANPYFEELLIVMNNFRNVYTDFSGTCVSGSRKASDIYKNFIVGWIKNFLEIKNGMRRMMFGTDFPIQSYEDSIYLVKRLGLSKDDESKIFYENALSILNLKEER